MLGEHLAPLLDATFIHQHFSRLVIDCNRDPRSAASIVEASDGTPVPGNLGLHPEAREARRAAIHEPYHARIAREIARRERDGARPILVALHSFTPVLGAIPRPWQLGVLHHRGDTRLSRATLARLRKEESLTVGDNEPYRMDGTDYTVPRHAYESGVPYLEVEFRQDLLADPDEVRAWATRFARWLTEAIAAIS
jgi:predicted N-formylglutamate amidohydrolase